MVAGAEGLLETIFMVFETIFSASETIIGTSETILTLLETIFRVSTLVVQCNMRLSH